MQSEISGIYGRCICCLAEGNHQHGELYIQVFTSCLNVIVSPGQTAYPMCSACISFLNEVQKFREMVLAAQRQLNDIISDNDIHGGPNVEAAIDEVKVKVESCGDTLDPTVWPETASDVGGIIPDAGVIDIKIEGSQTTMSTDNRKRRNVTRQPKRKRNRLVSESDTPISQIKRKTQLGEKRKKNVKSQSELQQLRSIIKENNKIRSNITLLLEHSTITPFLNNFKSAFKCFYCKEPYIPFIELKEHTDKEHTNICKADVQKALRKLPEYIVNADISCIKCKICDEQMKSIENLTEHLTRVHGKLYYDTDKKPSHGIIGFDLSKDDLKCHLCDKAFHFFKNLLVHMNEHGSFVCYICGKKLFSERKYRSHVAKHEKSEATCKRCNKTFSSKSALGHHSRKVHIKSRIKCPKCPQTFHFERYSQRLDHMEKAHGIKKPIFRCVCCGKEFKTSGCLSTHVNLAHKRTKEYRCDICNYATFNSSNYTNHVNTHNGVKNHECEYCKKRFLKSYSLTRHLMMHKNDKRFACPLCDCTFIQKANMKSHVRHRHKDYDVSKL